MERKFKIEIEVPIVKDKKQGNKIIVPERYDVKGMKNMILRSFDTKEQQLLVKEYAKFEIMDKAGIKVYPLEK